MSTADGDGATAYGPVCCCVYGNRVSNPAPSVPDLGGWALPGAAERVRHVERLPARPAREVPWPQDVHPAMLSALLGAGMPRAWTHQAQALAALGRGEHVVVATGTGSGKSLAYLVPGLSAVLDGLDAASGRGASVLYLSPTKALAADQRARIEAWQVPGVRVATYDGDTGGEERRWIRDHAHVVLSNPDLLHHSLLPGHRHWRGFLRALRFVVVDECHSYRGVFGAHVAAVLRRLRRVAAHYGASPQFVLASATVADPAEHAASLIGMPVTPVTDDGSPRGGLTFVLWEPPTVEGARRSATTEAGDVLAELVAADVQTVAFARSRAGVEALATRARAQLQRRGDPRADRIEAYRGGYLPEDRRAVEGRLRRREVLGVAATNALELGVDISGLDAVVLAGWPGRLASVWQQAGRAGRAGQDALAIFIAADDPLDTFVVHHPQALFAQPVEASVVDAGNPYVLSPHLLAAAGEVPLTCADVAVFGPSMPGCVDGLVAQGVLRARVSGWFVAEGVERSGVSLRGVGATVAIAERRTGRILGTVDEASSHAQVHAGAVHVHQGRTFVVTDLDLEAGVASVVAGDPGWSTFAQSVSEFALVAEQRRLPLLRAPAAVSTVSAGTVPAGTVSAGALSAGTVSAGTVSAGTVRVTHQVVGFLRRLPSGEVLGQHALDLPRRTLTTQAVWWTLHEDALVSAGLEPATWPGALHAAEHAAIGMLPLVASSDRWDVGGVSTALHPDTGLPTIMIYDGYPGGAGYAERAFDRWRVWLGATRDVIAACPCESGCPSCVQSPKCGNGNDPLDKAGAVVVLDLTLGAR